MQEMIDRLDAEGKKIGLVMNRRKPVIMKIQNDDQINCITGGEILPGSDSSRYLGTFIKGNGSLDKEFKERIKKAETAMGMLKTV